MCLCETWFKPELSTGMVNHNNRVLYRLDRPIKNAGGVAISVTSGMSRYTTLVPDYTRRTSDYESIGVLLRLPGEKVMLIVSLYRIPNTNVSNFISFVRSIASYEIDDNEGRHETWILGDINLNMNNTLN